MRGKATYFGKKICRKEWKSMPHRVEGTGRVKIRLK